MTCDGDGGTMAMTAMHDEEETVSGWEWWRGVAERGEGNVWYEANENRGVDDVGNNA